MALKKIISDSVVEYLEISHFVLHGSANEFKQTIIVLNCYNNENKDIFIEKRQIKNDSEWLFYPQKTVEDTYTIIYDYLKSLPEYNSYISTK